jgi:hypothetical protein
LPVELSEQRMPSQLFTIRRSHQLQLDIVIAIKKKENKKFAEGAA